MDNGLKDVNFSELLIRKLLLQTIINEYADDPRVEEPKRQLAIIESEISRRQNENLNDDAEPKDKEGLIVGLKTLNLKGKTNL